MLAFIQLIQNCKIQVFFTAKQLFFFRYFFKIVVEVNSSSSKLIQKCAPVLGAVKGRKGKNLTWKNDISETMKVTSWMFCTSLFAKEIRFKGF